MESETENLKFKQKCKDLKRRIEEIDENNEVVTIAISRTKMGIKKLRLEYAILLERLEKKTVGLTANPPTDLASIGLDSNNMNYSMSFSPELPTLKLHEVNPKTGANGGGRRKNGTSKLKAKQKERDPNLPKRPTNSYLIFCDLEKDNIKQKLEATNKDGQSHDMSKAMTEAWKLLSDEEKIPYVKLYEDDKERYNREIKIYNAQKKKETAVKGEVVSPPSEAGSVEPPTVSETKAGDDDEEDVDDNKPESSAINGQSIKQEDTVMTTATIPNELASDPQPTDTKSELLQSSQ